MTEFTSEDKMLSTCEYAMVVLGISPAGDILPYRAQLVEHFDLTEKEWNAVIKWMNFWDRHHNRLTAND